MELYHALALGIIQGFTEVLPISSSAHLILLPTLANWKQSGITFDVALHLGTFIALFVYFRQDVVQMIREGLSGFSRSDSDRRLKLPWMIVAASVPAALVGKTLEEPIEAIFRSNSVIIALLLIGFGLVLGLADTFNKRSLNLEQITTRHAIIIGTAQCLALMPGVSRSGITITAALLLGLCRTDAARFSFLLSLPIVFAAALLKTLHILKHGIEPGMLQPMLIGITCSAVTGYISVAFLLRFVQNRSLWAFSWYRCILGAVLLIWFI